MVHPSAHSPEDRNAIGVAAGGWVRVELDAAGRVSDVVLDPQAMTMSAGRLGEALVVAFQQAQETIRTENEATATAYGGGPSPERLRAAAEEATATAERRFEEISSVLYDLDRRAGSQW